MVGRAGVCRREGAAPARRSLRRRALSPARSTRNVCGAILCPCTSGWRIGECDTALKYGCHPCPGGSRKEWPSRRFAGPETLQLPMHYPRGAATGSIRWTARLGSARWPGAQCLRPALSHRAGCSTLRLLRQVLWSGSPRAWAAEVLPALRSGRQASARPRAQGQLPQHRARPGSAREGSQAASREAGPVHEALAPVAPRAVSPPRSRGGGPLLRAAPGRSAGTAARAAGRAPLGSLSNGVARMDRLPSLGYHPAR